MNPLLRELLLQRAQQTGIPAPGPIGSGIMSRGPQVPSVPQMPVRQPAARPVGPPPPMPQMPRQSGPQAFLEKLYTNPIGMAGLSTLAKGQRVGQTPLGAVAEGLVTAGLPTWQANEAADQAQYAARVKDRAIEMAMRGDPRGLTELMKVDSELALDLLPDIQRSVSQVSKGSVLVREDTGEVIYDNTQPDIPEARLADIETEVTAEAYFNKDFYDLDNMSQQQVLQILQSKKLALEAASAEIAGQYNAYQTTYETRLAQLVDQENALEQISNTATALYAYRDKFEEAGIKPYTGIFAGAQQFIGQVVNGLGLSDNERVSATQALERLLTSQSLNILGAFPGQLSEKELAVALFLAGQIRFEETNVDDILDFIENAQSGMAKSVRAMRAEMVANPVGNTAGLLQLNNLRPDYKAMREERRRKQEEDDDFNTWRRNRSGGS